MKPFFKNLSTEINFVRKLTLINTFIFLFWVGVNVINIEFFGESRFHHIFSFIFLLASYFEMQKYTLKIYLTSFNIPFQIAVFMLTFMDIFKMIVSFHYMDIFKNTPIYNNDVYTYINVGFVIFLIIIMFIIFFRPTNTKHLPNYEIFRNKINYNIRSKKVDNLKIKLDKKNYE